MNIIRRAVTFFIAVILMAHIFATTTFSVYEDPVFNLVWENFYYDGQTVSVTACLYAREATSPARQDLIDQYEPWIVVTNSDGLEIIRVRVTAPTYTLKLAKPDHYTVAVYDSAGSVLGGYTSDDSGYAPALFYIPLSTWGLHDDTETAKAAYYEDGFRFLAAFSEEGKRISVTLEPLVEDDSSTISDMIRKYRPSLYLVYYNADGSCSDGEEIPFQSPSLTINYSNYDGVSIEIFQQDGNRHVLKIRIEDGDTLFEPAWYEAGFTPSGGFQDINDQWFSPDVYFTAKLGLMKGTGNGRFSPYGSVSHGEAITLAARIHESMYGNEITLFDNGQWYQPYVDYARKHGISWSFQDYSADITREEFAHVLYSALGEEFYTEINAIGDGGIPDIPSSHKYYDEIYSLYRAGILSGCGADGAFEPKNDITRCEAAVIACRLVDSSFRVKTVL